MVPETAVDLETLEVLNATKVQFTILAPWQAESEDIDTNRDPSCSLYLAGEK